ncbi:MAG TPA: FdhF/YdeP family oxidoreductase [Chthoniobacterales bacterium]|nr:FdhF/YdeP family oxidoreductase [Chthoniobacterales bacterium]
MPEGSVPGAQPPIELEAARQTRRREAAAGISATVETARYVLRRMGVTRGVSALLQVNKFHGFDCQSCAWPNPDDRRHLAELCENGAKAISDEGTLRQVTPEFFAKYSIHELLQKSDFWLNEQGRLTHPMVLQDGSTCYKPISWDDAFSLLAEELNRLDSPNQAAFYTSGRTSNEAAYLYQLFARQFGTNNLPDCANLCHESSSAALLETIGFGKGTVTLHDFDMADAIFIVGQNPGTNHPRMLACLEQAKRHGAKIVSINPLPETGAFRFKNPRNPITALGGGTRLSDLWLPVRVNGDLALFKGIMKEMLATEDEKPGSVFDHDFIGRFTVGFEPFIDSLRAASWEPILAGSGLTKDQIRQAAHIAMGAKRIICCWATGLTQHRNAVATIREIINFLLLRGNIGRPGTGPCPVGGHSNVQGDRTMGIWVQPPAEFLDKLAERYRFEPPREAGNDVVETIKAMHRGRIKVIFALGGNFLSATPDTDFTAEALQNCRLTAHVSTKLNRAHLIPGRQALILPCLGRSEIDEQKGGPQFVTVEDSMGIINPSRGRLKPASKHLLSEPAIVARLAQAVLKERSQLRWQQWMDDYSTIRDEIEVVIPGFDRFNERIVEHVFYLPNGPRDKQELKTNTGKANFTVNNFELFDLPPGFFVLTTIRSQDQFNTTIYGLDDRYRGIYNSRRVLFMNAEDMREAGFQQGQPVDITSHFEGREREAQHFLVAPYSIPRQCVATYFPEGNVLVPIGSVAEISNTPTFKSIVVTLTPSPNVEAVRTELFAKVAEAKRLPAQIVAGTARLITNGQ